MVVAFSACMTMPGVVVYFPNGQTGSQVEVTGQSGVVDIWVYVLGCTDERMRFQTEFVEE